MAQSALRDSWTVTGRASPSVKVEGQASLFGGGTTSQNNSKQEAADDSDALRPAWGALLSPAFTNFDLAVSALSHVIPPASPSAKNDMRPQTGTFSDTDDTTD